MGDWAVIPRLAERGLCVIESPWLSPDMTNTGTDEFYEFILRCHKCPVRAECEATAISLINAHKLQYLNDIWAGLTPKELYAAARAEKKRAKGEKYNE